VTVTPQLTIDWTSIGRRIGLRPSIDGPTNRRNALLKLHDFKNWRLAHEARQRRPSHHRNPPGEVRLAASAVVAAAAAMGKQRSRRWWRADPTQWKWSPLRADVAAGSVAPEPKGSFRGLTASAQVCGGRVGTTGVSWLCAQPGSTVEGWGVHKLAERGGHRPAHGQCLCDDSVCLRAESRCPREPVGVRG